MQFSPKVRRYGPRVAAGSFAALGLTALAVLPSAAAPDFKAQFARLDANGDGVLSVGGFLGPDDKSVGGDERKVVIETRSIITNNEDGPDKPALATHDIKEDAFTFWLPEEIGAAKTDQPDNQHHEFKFISHREVKEVNDDDEGDQTSTQTYSFTVDDLRKQEFGSIDANKDGKVSLEEYRARQTEMLTRGFELLDADGDKSLSGDEYGQVVAPPMAKLNWKTGPDTPEPPQVDMPAMKEVSPEAIKAAFTRLDANKDGKLSLQEYLPKA